MSKEEMIPKVRFENYSKNKAWEEFKLGELVTIKSGVSPAAFKYGEELYVKVDDLNYSFKYQNDTNMKVAENLRYKKTKKGSVIFPKRGAAIMTNKVRIMGISGYMDTNMMALEPEGITTEFLYLYISKTGLYKIADTSTIPQINNKHIEPYKIIIPEENEQQKIGNLFEKLDQAISLQQQVLEATKEYKQSMQQKMFPKKDKKVPEIRFKEFRRKWEPISLKDSIDIQGGFAFKSSQFGSGKMPIIRISNIMNNGKIVGPFKYYKEKDNFEKYKVSGGEYLIAMSGATTGKVGINKDIAYVNQRVGIIKTKLNVDNFFIGIILNMAKFQYYLTTQWGAGAQPNVSNKQIMNYNTLIPSFEEQQKIGSFFKTLDKKIEQEEKKLETYQSMKKALMQRMFV